MTCLVSNLKFRRRDKKLKELITVNIKLWQARQNGNSEGSESTKDKIKKELALSILEGIAYA